MGGFAVSDESKAPARFAILTVVRLSAAAMIAGGILIAFGDNQWLGEDVRVPVGIGLILIGIVDMLLVVPMLARRWRSQP
jgi:Na+/phosphate symporter